MSFNNLNLSNVSTQDTPRLKTGSWHVTVSDAVYKDNSKKNGKVVVVELSEKNGMGKQRMSFNVEHANPEAAEIGLRQFKTFLTNARHPNPDHPNDIRSLLNLELMIHVVENGTFTTDGGKVLPNYEVNATSPLEGTAAPAPNQPVQQNSMGGGYSGSGYGGYESNYPN